MTQPIEVPLSELLGGFQSFDGLSREDLLVLASRAELLDLAPRSVLFRHGDQDPWMHCLLEGTVSLKAADGREHRIEAGSGAAARIISRLKPRRYTVTAVTPVRLIRIDGSGMGYWHSAVDPAMVQVEEISDLQYLDDAASRDAGTKLEVDDFQLPSLPAVALKARALIDDDECDVDMVARVVNSDPSMAAKLIKAANSPVFYGTHQVATSERAIVRLGLHTTRQLIMAFAMREMFEMDVPEFGELVTELWDHSAEVAAIAFVLARHTRTFDAGEAQLAGLLHDIGVVPVLHGAAQHPGLVCDTEAVLAMAKGQRATLGRQVLESWHFPAALVDAAADAEDWWRDSVPEADLTDVVIVAQLLSFIGKARILDVPPVVRVPAFRRLLGDSFDAAAAMALLDEAGEQIAEVRALLKG